MLTVVLEKEALQTPKQKNWETTKDEKMGKENKWDFAEGSWKLAVGRQAWLLGHPPACVVGGCRRYFAKPFLQ